MNDTERGPPPHRAYLAGSRAWRTGPPARPPAPPRLRERATLAMHALTSLPRTEREAELCCRATTNNGSL
ncbi:jg15143 [Pararge aegeria aegeria]|uniref:Jg15143 protein n=1 Tax=Pararge aegeria aegeria TaxID=348720 RepID=A0A8S4S3H5_9NEOP|nr:jg15143 [Pararge aegeria aegeria]